MNNLDPFWYYTPVPASCTGCGTIVTPGNRYFIFPQCGSRFCVAPPCGPHQVRHFLKTQAEQAQSQRERVTRTQLQPRAIREEDFVDGDFAATA